MADIWEMGKSLMPLFDIGVSWIPDADLIDFIETFLQQF